MNEEDLHDRLTSIFGKDAAEAGISERDIREGVAAFIDYASEMVDLHGYTEDHPDDVGLLVALFFTGISFGRATMGREMQQQEAFAHVNNAGMLQ